MGNWKNRIDMLLANAVEAGTAPGLVAMVANRDAELYAGCAGVSDIDQGIGMTTDAIFWLASFTKLVTSIAALQLVERGQLHLDEPIDQILPAMTGYQVLDGFGAGDAPLLRAPSRPITLRHLLSHTSGIGYDLMDEHLLRARGEAGPPPPTTLASLRGPLRFDPGEGWVYGAGIDWVGLIVEAVSGQPLDRYFDTEIFGPVGMNDTGFTAPEKRRAKLYSRTGPKVFAPMASAVDDLSQWEYLSGGGGLFSTAKDFSHLLQSSLNGGKAGDNRILGEATVDLLFQSQTGTIRAGVIPSVVSGINARFDLFPDMQTGWSLGGMINPEAIPGGRSGHSMAWAGIANTYYWVDRGTGICAILLAQYLPLADPAMIKTLHTFEAAVYAAGNQ